MADWWGAKNEGEKGQGCLFLAFLLSVPVVVTFGSARVGKGVERMTPGEWARLGTGMVSLKWSNGNGWEVKEGTMVSFSASLSLLFEEREEKERKEKERKKGKRSLLLSARRIARGHDRRNEGEEQDLRWNPLGLWPGCRRRGSFCMHPHTSTHIHAHPRSSTHCLHLSEPSPTTRFSESRPASKREQEGGTTFLSSWLSTDFHIPAALIPRQAGGTEQDGQSLHGSRSLC